MLTFLLFFYFCFILANWKQELLKIIDADQLPVKWGGTAVDEDGDICCKSKVSSYFMCDLPVFCEMY